MTQKTQKNQSKQVRECDSRGCRQRNGVMITSYGEFCPRCLESLFKVVMLLKTSGPEGGYWQVIVRRTVKEDTDITLPTTVKRDN